MPRVAARTPPRRAYCRTEFHPKVEEYIKDLADEMGVEPAYIIRLCVAGSLPQVEATLRSGERPHDEMKRPSKPLKTRAPKPRTVPQESALPAPALAAFLEDGVMPFEPEPSVPPLVAEPSPEPPPREAPQEPERPAEPPAEPSPAPLPDPLHASASPHRIQRRRRG